MNEIKYVLLCDGSSDKMLIPIIDWLLHAQCQHHAIKSQWADLGRFRHPPRNLTDKIKKTVEIYQPDLLFIHRDAEKQPFELRRAQIMDALAEQATPPAVCIIPIRMQEAWLLFDEQGIRKAAGNPRGGMVLHLPRIDEIESIPDPKALLFSLINTASGCTGRRLKKLKAKKLAHLLSQQIDDFASLRSLSAFHAFESELSALIQANGWNVR